MRISEIAICNPKNPRAGKYSFINYLDTASVEQGVLSKAQRLTKCYPSRAQRKVLPGDILISSVRPNLQHNFFVEAPLENMIASTGFIQVRVLNDKAISPRFLYYFLTSPGCISYFSRIAECSQSSYPSIKKDVIESLEVPLFSFPEQQRIANTLGSIDEKIEVNRQKIVELENLARLIYEYWFLQFDFPNEEGLPYRTSGGRLIWNDELRRKIPEGWQAEELSSLLKLSKVPKNPASCGNEILEHYSIPAFDDGLYPVFEPAVNIKSVKYTVPNSSILVSKLNPHFKRVWDPYCQSDRAVCSTEFMVCVSKDKTNRPFCYVILNSDIFQTYMISGSTGGSTGSRKRFSPENLLKFKFAFPDKQHMDIITRFNSFYGDILAQIKSCRLEIKALSDMRDFLLPLLINGQMIINDRQWSESKVKRRKNGKRT